MNPEEIKTILKTINDNIEKINKRLDDFESRLESLEGKRNEMYYQKFLEKYLGATHKKTKYGITDITTSDYHIEIKPWYHYKQALGQLLSYNFKNDKKLSAYFFGTIKNDKKVDIIELYKSKGVEVYEFIDTIDGIKINCLLNYDRQDVLDEKQIFYNWLDKNIEYDENELLQLTDICENFLNKSNLHSSLLTKYKKWIENFIKETYLNIRYEYGVVKIDNKTFNGWKHLCLKNNEKQMFYNWLDENIVYKENELLQLKDIVEGFLGYTVKNDREKSKYKKEIEKYIKDRFKNIRYEYGKVRYHYTNNHGQKTTYGWKHLSLK